MVFRLLIFGAIGTLPWLGAQSRELNPEQTVRMFQFVATDAKGQPITDLRPDEILVSDQGKRRPLAFSQFQARAAPAPAALGPHEFSNRGGAPFPASTLILIDLFNADFDEHSTVWDQTIRTLEKAKSSESAFLFLLAPDATLLPIHTWTAPGPSTGQAPELLDQGFRAAEKHKRLAAPDANLTYQALKMLGAQYAAMPGPKRLIWLMRGMPLTVMAPNGPLPLAFQTLLQQTGVDFQRLGIPIYTVHQKEIHTGNVNKAIALDSLAALTGGRNFEEEAVGPAIADTQTDARATYQAGYYWNDKDADNKFHELRVSTNRKGARILAPDGYMAEPVENIAASALQLAQTRALDTSDIGLRVSLETLETNTHFQIHVDPRDLLLQQARGSQACKLFLAFVYTDADGERTATEPVSTNVDSVPSQSDATIKNDYLVTVDQTLPAGTTKVRVVVLDASTGIAGSLSVPITRP